MRRVVIIALLAFSLTPAISIADAGYALQFDGVDDQVDMGNNYMLINSNMTIEFWIQTQQTSSAVIAGKHYWPGYNGYTIDINCVNYGCIGFLRHYE